MAEEILDETNQRGGTVSKLKSHSTADASDASTILRTSFTSQAAAMDLTRKHTESNVSGVSRTGSFLVSHESFESNHNALREFYEKVDPDRVKNVEPLFMRFSDEDILEAIRERYGETPNGWISTLRRDGSMASFGSFAELPTTDGRDVLSEPRVKTTGGGTGEDTSSDEDEEEQDVVVIDGGTRERDKSRTSPGTMTTSASPPTPPKEQRKTKSFFSLFGRTTRASSSSSPSPPTNTKAADESSSSPTKSAATTGKTNEGAVLQKKLTGEETPVASSPSRPAVQTVTNVTVTESPKPAPVIVPIVPTEKSTVEEETKKPVQVVEEVKKVVAPESPKEDKSVVSAPPPAPPKATDDKSVSSPTTSSNDTSSIKPAATPDKPVPAPAPTTTKSTDNNKPVTSSGKSKDDDTAAGSKPKVASSLAARQAMLAGVIAPGGGGGGAKPAATLKTESKAAPAKKWGKVDTNGPGSDTTSVSVISKPKFPDTPPASLEKYERMVKSGLPQGAVENAMTRDGINPDWMFNPQKKAQVVGGGGGAPPTSTPVANATPASPPAAAAGNTGFPNAYSASPPQAAARLPAPMFSAPQDAWIQVYSYEHNANYWFNQVNGQTTWTSPYTTTHHMPPPPPPPPSSTRKLGVVVIPYFPQGIHPQEMSVNSMEQVEVLRITPEGWMIARHLNSGTIGFVPASHVRAQF